MHAIAAYMRKVQNSACAAIHTGLKMLFLDVPCLTLLIQRLGQLTTKLFIATRSPLFLSYFKHQA